jgi:hypothetical protein
MNNQTANTIKNILSAIALILIISTAATAFFLVSDNNGVGRLLSESIMPNTVNAFAQQQNKTDTTSSGNNTNTTITAASSFCSSMKC